MEWYLTIVIAYISFSKASAVIIEGPRSGAYPEGTNVTLQCLAQGNNRIVWEDIKENTVIFIDKAKNTQKAKFDNFVISEAEDNFSLTIVDAQLSDDGFYSCEEGDESRNANVTVEAGPTLSISLNDTLLASPYPLTLTEDEVIVVVCKAEGSKPAVDLRLKFGGDEWIEEVNVTTLKEGMRSTTKARIVHRVTNIVTNFTCQAFGQTSIPPVTKIIHIDIRYKPKCQIYLENNLAECQCVSNPAVSSYKMYVDGELKSTDPTLPMQEYLQANVTCQATNDVGTGTLASKFVTPIDGNDSTNIVLIIIAVGIAVAIVAVCGCLIFALFRRCHKKSTNNTFVELISEQPAQNEEEQRPLVPIHGKDSPEFQTFVSQIAETILRDWEILAVEDLKLNRDKVKQITKEELECKEQVKLVIKLWSQKEDGEISKSELARILSQSSVCNDVRCNNCKKVIRSIPGVILHYPGTTDAEAGTPTEKKPRETHDESTKTYPTESDEFSKLLENVAKVIGHTGALKLSKEYGVDKNDGDSTVKDLSIIGEDIIRLLVEKGLLEHSITSLNGFQNKLEGFCLYRASNLVDAYILHKEAEQQLLTEYISEISRTILYDWEILAIETLSVDKSKVEEIIKKYTNCEDQVMAVLHIWQTSFRKSARRSDLEEIINKSEVFKEQKGLKESLEESTTEEPNDKAGTHLSNTYSINENGSRRKTNIPSTFQELLVGFSKLLGDTGVRRILGAYYEQTNEVSVDKTLTTESVLQLLQEKNILADEWEPLKLFSARLKNCLLFRASFLFDAYLAKKEKTKLVTTGEPVPLASKSSTETQSSQESKAGHASNKEQDDSAVQPSSENLQDSGFVIRD